MGTTALALLVVLFAMTFSDVLLFPWVMATTDLRWNTAEIASDVIGKFAAIVFLLAVVFIVEGNSYSSIGVNPSRRSDLLILILCFIFFFWSQRVLQLLLRHSAARYRTRYEALSTLHSFRKLPMWFAAIASITNGFFEEFAIRAYTMERVEAITGSVFAAACVSFALAIYGHWAWGLYGSMVIAPANVMFLLLYLFRRNLPLSSALHATIDFTGMVWPMVPHLIQRVFVPL